MTGTRSTSRKWAWHKLSKQRLAIAAANQEPCCRCGRPIDYTLPGNTRWGPTAAHQTPAPGPRYCANCRHQDT